RWPGQDMQRSGAATSHGMIVAADVLDRPDLRLLTVLVTYATSNPAAQGRPARCTARPRLVAPLRRSAGSVRGAPRHDPPARLTGDLGDQLVVRVLVQHRHPPPLGHRRSP